MGHGFYQTEEWDMYSICQSEETKELLFCQNEEGDIHMFARLKLWTNAAQVCGQLISSDFDTGALCFSRQLKFAKQMHWPIFISVKFRLF